MSKSSSVRLTLDKGGPNDFIDLRELDMVEPQEFYAREKFPNTSVPPTTKWQKFWCWITGGHNWHKFLWGGIHSMFDCDMCPKCFKMRGPLPENRVTKVFPCRLR